MRTTPWGPNDSLFLRQKHRDAKHALFVDEVDEALYAAMDRVLKAAAKGPE